MAAHNGLAQGFQRGGQLRIINIFKAAREFCGFIGLLGRRRFRDGRGDRPLIDPDPVDGAVAKITVDPLDELRLQMHEFDREATARDFEIQRAVTPVTPRICDPLGRRNLGHGAPDDVRPLGDDGAVGQAAFAEKRLGNFIYGRGDGPGAATSTIRHGVLHPLNYELGTSSQSRSGMVKSRAPVHNQTSCDRLLLIQSLG